MKYLMGLCCLLLTSVLFAQPESVEEEIFIVVEDMPIFPGCAELEGSSQEIKECSDKRMLEFIYGNIRYPEIDRQNRNEGTVVIRFVVEKDGSISNATIMRDKGEQLGTEALRVVELMKTLPDKWTPGKQRGIPVRVYRNVPVKFKIKEVKEPDFVMSGQDSVWVKFDAPALYKGEQGALEKYIDDELKFPNEGQDSCRIGIIEANTLLREDGTVNIIDVIDYSGLGIDYQFEAIRLINATSGEWNAATFGERKVNTSQGIRITFRPNLEACGNTISNFKDADKAVDDAAILLQEGQVDEGIAKLTEAITMFPKNGEYLSLRGQAYLQMNKSEEACADLKQAKEILVVSWYDALIPILCKDQ